MTDFDGCPICDSEADSCQPRYRGPGLKIIWLPDPNEVEDEEQMPTYYTLTERLFVNRARDRIVPGDSEEAFFQLGTAGHKIHQDMAIHLGLMDAPPPPPPRDLVPDYPAPHGHDEFADVEEQVSPSREVVPDDGPPDLDEPPPEPTGAEMPLDEIEAKVIEAPEPSVPEFQAAVPGDGPAPKSFDDELDRKDVQGPPRRGPGRPRKVRAED